MIQTIHTDPAFLIKDLIDSFDSFKSKTLTNKIFSTPRFIVRHIYRFYARRKHLKNKYRLYIDKSDAVVLLSDCFKESYLKLCKFGHTSKLYAISNPLSYKSVSINTKEKKNIVLYIGRLTHSPKRVDRLLRIWSMCKTSGWKLIIIGEGPEKTNLESSSTQGNVLFIGQQNPEKFLKEASILCLTSTHEGFGLVLTEALQYGVVPITFDSSASFHDIIVDNKNGVLVRSFDEKKFAYQLQRLIDDDNLLNEYRHNIKETDMIQKFDLDNVIKEWEELFYKIIKSKHTI